MAFVAEHNITLSFLLSEAAARVLCKSPLHVRMYTAPICMTVSTLY